MRSIHESFYQRFVHLLVCTHSSGRLLAQERRSTGVVEAIDQLNGPIALYRMPAISGPDGFHGCRCACSRFRLVGKNANLNGSDSRTPHRRRFGALTSRWRRFPSHPDDGAETDWTTAWQAFTTESKAIFDSIQRAAAREWPRQSEDDDSAEVETQTTSTAASDRHSVGQPQIIYVPQYNPRRYTSLLLLLPRRAVAGSRIASPRG